jgi:membrane-associated phospholipid phosphatase
VRCSRRLLALLVLVFLLMNARTVEAKPLAYDLRVDLPLTLIGGALWLSGGLAKDVLIADQCRWCRDNSFDRNAREALRWQHPLRGGTLSNVLVSSVIPGVALGGLALARWADHESMRDSWQDALFVMEATSVTVLLNLIVKLAVARERPYAHYGDFAGQPTGSFERTSFYSNHTDIAFSLAASAGMVASLRGYRAAPVIWSVGMAAASVAGYARVAGDYHYLSDVLVGAALGSLIGMGIPWLLHRPKAGRGVARNLRLSAGANNVVLTWRH